jgi:hypothetical protein
MDKKKEVSEMWKHRWRYTFGGSFGWDKDSPIYYKLTIKIGQYSFDYIGKGSGVITAIYTYQFPKENIKSNEYLMEARTNELSVIAKIRREMSEELKTNIAEALLTGQHQHLRELIE